MKDLTLHIEQSFIIETWHIQWVMESCPDSGIGIEFLIILINSFILWRCFNIAWSDKMFLPIFDVIKLDNVDQSLGPYHQSLNHLITFLIYSD